MTGFTPLLIHTASLYASKTVNINGRVATSPRLLCKFRCRFVQPTPSPITIQNGAVENMITATVYADITTADAMQGHKLPLLIRTTDSLWGGDYEMRKPPRVYESHSTPHHIEFDVVRVNHDFS